MGLWATKAGMTQIFTPEGLALPATVLAMEEGNIVTQAGSCRLSPGKH
jgi:large subunit ribosomal protein L3